MKGWIPAWRRLFSHDHWLAPTKKHPGSRREAWLYLCQLAQHDDFDHAGHSLKRGEFIMSQRTLAKEMCWSQASAGRFMDRLKCESMIESVSESPRGTVYRIVNYDTYAVVETSERVTPRVTQRVTTESRTTMNNQKERNYTSDFEEIWAIHRKGPKAKAFDQYKRAVSNGITHEELADALTRYTSTFRQDFTGAHLHRWIKDERWEDAPPAKRSGPPEYGRLQP